MNNQLAVDMQQIKAVAHTIFASSPDHIERMTEGISTIVYRIKYRAKTFYLRLHPDLTASYASEVAVHNKLRQLQVRVPEVVHFEPYNEIAQRSIMLITEIDGLPVTQSLDLSANLVERIMEEAGRDLARINSIAVEGFGWIERHQGDVFQSLCATSPGYRAFMLKSWDAHVDFLAKTALTSSEISMLEWIIERDCYCLDAEKSYLAHGDFSIRHIYQSNGQYTGIIDFGDMLSADRWYDLGHFHMRDGGSHRLSALLKGYGEVVSLPDEYEHLIRLSSILIAVPLLVSMVRRNPLDEYIFHFLQVLRENISFLRYTT